MPYMNYLKGNAYVRIAVNIAYNTSYLAYAKRKIFILYFVNFNTLICVRI